jgi:hypothetical protein
MENPLTQLVEPAQGSANAATSPYLVDTEIQTENRYKGRVTKALDIVVRVCELGEYDTNVIGMAAEIIAEDVFGMTKASRGSRDVDGSWMRGDVNRTVQVKAWSERRIKRYKRGTFLTLREASLPDDLLLLLIYSSKPGYEILYNGPANHVGTVDHRGIRVVQFGALKTREEIIYILSQFEQMVDVPKRKSNEMNKKQTDKDRFIESAVRKHPSLAFHVNAGNEHCVEIVGRERKGSLWLRPRYKGYRIQTTGQAQRLDSLIESLCGPAEGSDKPQVYQYWYTDGASSVEAIIDRFATLA